MEARIVMSGYYTSLMINQHKSTRLTLWGSHYLGASFAQFYLRLVRSGLLRATIPQTSSMTVNCTYQGVDDITKDTVVDKTTVKNTGSDQGDGMCYLTIEQRDVSLDGIK